MKPKPKTKANAKAKPAEQAKESALARWWFAAAPAERLAAFRILLGLFIVDDLFKRLPSLIGYTRFPATEFEPVGVVNLVLDRPLEPVVAQVLVYLALGLAVLFTAGLWWRVVAPLLAVTLLWVLTYRNSYNMMFHTENLEVIHPIILAFAPAADAWSIDAWRRARRGLPPPAPHGRYGWALRAICAVTVITYVLAGIAKLRLLGADWLGTNQLRDQIAYDNLRRAVLGARPSAYATPLLEYPQLFHVLAWLTMAVELGAPLALLHRRIALVWAATAWGFHVGVLYLMHIMFPYPLFGLAYAAFFRLERPLGWIFGKVAALWRWLTARRGRRSPG